MPKFPSKKFVYDEQALLNAICAVKSKKLSVRKASEKYGVPRSTLQDKLTGKTIEEYRKMGPDTILNTREEKKLVEWMIDLTKCGFPRKPDDLLNTVQKIVREDKRKNPFNHDRPGKTWYSLFMKRHPVLTLREPEGISKGRGVVTEEIIRKWFKELEEFMESQDATDVLLDPKRIFNCDETSFSMCPKSGKVIAPKGWKNVYTVKPGSEKETITCLFTFSANGDTVTPMVVFPYVRPPRDIINSVPDSWFLGRSETGWMRSETFFEFVANGFNQWLTDHDIQRPVLLLVDGHKSHLTMELSEFCQENQIILYSFLPNCTHILQMADVSVFKSLKTDYKKTVREWQNQSENLDCTLTKVTFCPLIEYVLQQKNLEEAIRNGFRATGIFPFDPDAVDYSKCVQNVIEKLNSKSLPKKPSIDDITTTSNVLKSLRDSLIAHDINVDLLLQVLEKEKQSPALNTIASNEIVLASESDHSSMAVINTVDLNNDENEFVYICDANMDLDLGYDCEMSSSTDLTTDSDLTESNSETSNDLTNNCDISDANMDLVLGYDCEMSSSTDLTIDSDLTESNSDIVNVKPNSVPEYYFETSNDSTNNCDRAESNTSIVDVTPLSVTDNDCENSSSTDLTNDSERTESNSDIVNVTPNSASQSPNFDMSSLANPIAKDFQKHLFYPKPIGSGKKRKEKVKTPMAISAPQWREMKKRIEDEKREKVEAIQKRKLERAEKTKQKVAAVEQRKKDRIEKARAKAEITLNRLKQKMDNLKQKKTD